MSLRDQIFHLLPLSYPTLLPPNSTPALTVDIPYLVPFSHLYLPLESHPLLSLVCSVGRIPVSTLDSILISIFPVCSMPLLTLQLSVCCQGTCSDTDLTWVRYGALNQEPELDGRKCQKALMSGLMQGNDTRKVTLWKN